jgi:hypothetical protein
MRLAGIAACLLLTGCTGISTIPFSPPSINGSAEGGMPYSLPKGVVPIQVFADETGIGMTIEPAQIVSDG